MRTHWRLAQPASCLSACLLESYLQHKVSPSMQTPPLHAESSLALGMLPMFVCTTSIAARILTSTNAWFPLNQTKITMHVVPGKINEYLSVSCLGQSLQLEVMLCQLTTQSGPRVLQSSLTLLSAHSSGTCMVLG